jgi:hypothetical protein
MILCCHILQPYFKILIFEMNFIKFQLHLHFMIIYMKFYIVAKVLGHKFWNLLSILFHEFITKIKTIVISVF